MEMRHLSYFVEIAQLKSFTKAAQKLNISQPALSKCIRNLEDELDVSLFIRDNGTISLTSEGELVYDKAKELLSHFNSVKDVLTDIKTGERKNISVGCSSLISALIGLDVISSAFVEVDNVNLHYREDNTDRLIQDVFNMELDFAVVILCDREYKYLDKLSCEEIYEGEFVAVTASGGKADVGRDSKLVIPSGLLEMLKQRLGGKELCSVICTDRFEEMKNLVSNKGFTAIVPDMAIQYLGSQFYSENLNEKIAYKTAFVKNKSEKGKELIKYLKQYIGDRAQQR